ELLEAIERLPVLLREPLEVVAEPLRLVVARGALLELADRVGGAAADAAVEVAVARALERRDRGRVAERLERLGDGRARPEERVVEEALEDVAHVLLLRLVLLAAPAARQHRLPAR